MLFSLGLEALWLEMTVKSRPSEVRQGLELQGAPSIREFVSTSCAKLGRGTLSAATGLVTLTPVHFPTPLAAGTKQQLRKTADWLNSDTTGVRTFCVFQNLLILGSLQNIHISHKHTLIYAQIFTHSLTHRHTHTPPHKHILTHKSSPDTQNSLPNSSAYIYCYHQNQMV